jgi:5'(3')-deoxyribonucleotidase
MNKPIIAVDIDDVLAANADGFTAYSNQKWGTSLSPSDYQEHWSEMWGLDHNETDRRAVEFHASGVIGTYEHYPDALHALRQLIKSYDLIIITSRRVSVMNETLDWLDRYFHDLFTAVHFAGIYDTGRLDDGRFAKTKLDVVQAQKVNYLIDDQIKHCTAVAEAGVNAVLFGDYPWNQVNVLPNRVTRCKDWAAVLEYFDGLERA